MDKSYSETSWAEKSGACPEKLREIIEEFREADARDRMEYLIEYAFDLPELPERFQSKRDEMEQVHECQTPVFLITEVANDHVDFFLDIPMESPTVRGYASVLVDGLADATIDEVLATPDDVYMLLNLQEVVTPQRLRGLHFLMYYMKRQVMNQIGDAQQS